MSQAVQFIQASQGVASDSELSQRWLSALEDALQGKNKAAAAALFATDDCHWRDVLAFTWFITPHRGANEIGTALINSHAVTKAHGFAIAKDRTPSRRVKRAGILVIETIFEFETAVGRGYGVLRLKEDKPWEAFQLMTSLHELKGFEEHVDKNRPTGSAYSRNFGDMNWKDQRIKSQAYDDREPVVLVAGGGQAGLSVAARLVRLGVDTLVVDKHERAGDCWRKRYHSLALHNYTDFNHLPYMPFPASWPAYLPKDMVADWFEAYVWAMEINYWASAEFTTATYDEVTGKWKAVVCRADGTERILYPRHLILAGGLNGKGIIPSLPGLQDFKGDVMHSSQFTTGANWSGKKALVLGTGNSAHDVAQDLHSNDVDTTIVQRGSTTVVSVNPSAKLIHASALDGTPLEDSDLIATTNTLPVMTTNLQLISARMVELDKALIKGLIACGFKWDMGEDNTGHQMKIRKRSGGYYLNIGCSELIIKGEIGLLQYDQIEKFVPEGALLKDGSIKPADLVVTATGFQPLELLVRELLGDEIANRVGPVWGFGADGEMNNMWKRTGQEGLWLVGSGFAVSRQYSRVVALQIKAIEEGLLSKKR
ncbi:MAG: NAD(P)/FAD-dependent oxidoreductase [Betaproteobacteria bacterium]|nr:NAD(P)/FAD-dependent oxidoreductase [Betaproteobacteria bacterium]